MGYKNCAVSGCRSKTGEGKIFKLFPHANVVLSQKWLERLPGYRPAKSAAFCEDHFDLNQFERLRQDGKRKLKQNAVPSIFPGDKENVPLKRPSAECNESPAPVKKLHTSTPLPLHTPSTPPQTDRFLGTSTPIQSRVPFNSQISNTFSPVLEDITNFRPKTILVYNASIIPKPPNKTTDTNSSSINLEINYEDGHLDETTGSFLPTPTSNSSLGGAVPVDNVAEGSTLGQCNLDETSGLWVPRTDSEQSQEEIECNQNDIYCEKENLLSLDKDTLVEIILSRNAELERANALNEAKDQQIAYLLEGGDFGMAWKRKYDAERKSKSRYQATVQRLSSASPWLSESQMLRLSRHSSRGVEWTSEEIRKGLVLKMKCGSTGYSAFVQLFPLLPSLRTLQQSVQHILFAPGELHNVYDMLETLSENLPEMHKDCQIVVDEFAIARGPAWCNSLKTMLGKATLPGHTGYANKALLFLLAGISVRWKLSVHIEFTSKKDDETPSDATGEAYATIFNRILTRTEEIGFHVCNITSDMGAENLSFWKYFGITGGRSQIMKSSIPHPIRLGSEVFVCPDAVHVMKCMKSMFEGNGTITLPADIVEEENLPSAVVDYSHIDDLLEYEEGFELKVAFRLRKKNVHCDSQFKSMNVGTAKAVICHRTGVALKLLAQETENYQYETTSWFIILMNTFFDLMTCRRRGLAISKDNMVAYNKAIKLIQKVEYMFTHMTVGDKGKWKPVQRGIRVLCNSALGLIHYFLEERKYKYLMLGRFTSDCIENLISLLRLKQKVPNCQSVLQCLKVITLAQFSEAVKGSSYDYEEGEQLPVNFLELAQQRAKKRAEANHVKTLDEIRRNPVKKFEDNECFQLDTWERTVIYDMAGSVVNRILNANKTVCDSCIDALKWEQGQGELPASCVTVMKEYHLLRSDDESEPLQIYVSYPVFIAVMKMELTFRALRDDFVSFESTNVVQYFVESLMYVWDGCDIPNCHSLGKFYIQMFLDARLKEWSKICREAEKQKYSKVPLSSKSVAQHHIAENVKTSRYANSQ